VGIQPAVAVVLSLASCAASSVRAGPGRAAWRTSVEWKLGTSQRYADRLFEWLGYQPQILKWGLNNNCSRGKFHQWIIYTLDTHS
jgi:hypothetical protein